MMKTKLLVGLVAILLANSVLAETPSARRVGAYIGLEGGMSFNVTSGDNKTLPSENSLNESSRSSSAVTTIKGGYSYGNGIRTELSYSKYGKTSEHYSYVDPKASAIINKYKEAEINSKNKVKAFEDARNAYNENKSEENRKALERAAAEERDAALEKVVAKLQMEEYPHNLSQDIKWNVKSDTVMANVYYDFQIDADSATMPYVMVGLGLAHNELNGNWGGQRINGEVDSISVSKAKSTLAYQIGFGVTYAFTKNLLGDIGIKYTDRGTLSINDKFKTANGNTVQVDHSVKLTSVDTTIGIRYLF